MYAASESGVFKSSYYYQMQRSINGYDPNNLGGPPVTPGYPLGNPNLPYFKLHGADMPWVFGNLGELRDINDLLLNPTYIWIFRKFCEERGSKSRYKIFRSKGL